MSLIYKLCGNRPDSGSNSVVIKIDISDLCLQSSPCQHYCRLFYADGSTKDVQLNSREIYDNYKHLIDDKDISHYKYVNNSKVLYSRKHKLKYRFLTLKDKINYFFNCSY
jgi:hypothetical protein